MKKRRLRQPPPAPTCDAPADFVRGFITTGLLCSLQGQGMAGPQGKKAILRHALQGGTALAAGTAAVGAIKRRNYSAALMAVAGGAAGLVAIDYLLHDKPCADSKEKDDGQEKEA